MIPGSGQPFFSSSSSSSSSSSDRLPLAFYAHAKRLPSWALGPRRQALGSEGATTTRRVSSLFERRIEDDDEDEDEDDSGQEPIYSDHGP
jgi:hypothetical protein